MSENAAIQNIEESVTEIYCPTESRKTIEIKGPTLLLVEGKDDAFFCQEFIKYLGLENIQIADYQGTSQLNSFLKFLTKSEKTLEKINSLGIIRDADKKPKTSFKDVQNALQRVGLSKPDTPLDSVGDNPRVTIMLLPGDCKSGMLEDLCLEAVAEDPAMECVEQFCVCLKEKGQSPSKNLLSKAKLQVFLAAKSRKKLKHHLGLAARAGVLPWDSKVFEEVKRFLQQICE